MAMTDAKVQCDYCERWLTVENGNSAECSSCDAMFAVTVTKILQPGAETAETPQ